MSRSFDNRNNLDSVVGIKEEFNRPAGASPLSKQSVAVDPHTTMYERSAMQGNTPITSQEASQISMPSAPSMSAHNEPTNINSVHSLSPQGTAVPQGVMAVFGHLKPLMPENGHSINQSTFQTISNFGQGSFTSSQSHFQASGNSQNIGFQPQGSGSIWTDLPRGQNPLKQIWDLAVRSIIDWLF